VACGDVRLALIEKQLQLLISGKWVDRGEKRSEARTRFLIELGLEFSVYRRLWPRSVSDRSTLPFICESCSEKTTEWY